MRIASRQVGGNVSLNYCERASWRARHRSTRKRGARIETLCKPCTSLSGLIAPRESAGRGLKQMTRRKGLKNSDRSTRKRGARIETELERHRSRWARYRSTRKRGARIETLFQAANVVLIAIAPRESAGRGLKPSRGMGISARLRSLHAKARGAD